MKRLFELFGKPQAPDESYITLKGYELIDHQDTLSLSACYDPTRFLPKEVVPNEHMYLLKKTSVK